MNKTYNHKEVELNTDRKWQDKKYFMTHDLRKKPFSILLPPPNVTGKLHLGHSLDSYIPDTVIRYKKLNNYDVFWIAGMDHAGIATQAKVEQVLYEETGLTRHDLGREKFLAKVWEWKETYAQMFRKQWSALGLALDYENERFTLDDDANEAVLKVFVDLYNKGLIYRDTKAISWDTKLNTALSNIEVYSEDTKQNMYHIKYFIENSDQFITVATVRTETLLSDVAVVVNPNDERYKHLWNKNVIHPITKELLPIITDEYVGIDFGSGAMKLSAHAEVDINIIKKHNLEIRETINKSGFIDSPQTKYHGLDRFAAREAIANDLKANDLLVKVEETTSPVGFSERSKTPIEILVTPQWFVKMDKLAQGILNHLDTDQKVKFYPERFEATMRQWMENVHDWTISRQLWWGHRIPAWYKDDQIKVQIDSPGEGWVQDEDVLDTWFSSGISPFVFLGWPQSDEKLKRYYPSDVLITGYDLVFFWVARMYFFGLEFMNEKPFKDVLFHGLIRDEQNRKMSKSLNNGIDPMEVIDQYGSDALRWFLITNTSPGIDIRYSTEKIKSAWGVCNKLWNISRYIHEMNDGVQTSQLSDIDKWINNKLFELKNNIDRWMSTYEFTLIGSEIYKFIFNDFSSWYIELLKTAPSKQNALAVLRNALIIIHPLLPFTTDKIFSEIFNNELLEQTYPELEYYDNVEYVDTLIEIVTIIRKYRDENNISKKEIINYHFESANEVDSNMFKGIDKLAYAQQKLNQDLLFTTKLGNLYIEVSQELKEQNKQRLLDKIAQIKFEIDRAQKMLSNESFISKAPEAKIAIEREKLAKYTNELSQYEEELQCKYCEEKN
ncbi:valine--tRNA ligase [Mycoplasmopsis pullorum]|uniref:Valine--tRNA ligase n=1 Tax=Mycoplasmopsis pullorum TaxID=48003 RepID=A0A1L4FRW3_9BACT|nr:valine--tRNA ligase [Mycoplasmopsis pullorum]APJ38334.1 valine--tRNA ligase [Mycoplasmopsis pullorum]